MICPYCGYEIFPKDPWDAHKNRCKHRVKARFDLVLSAISGHSVDPEPEYVASRAVALADQVLEKLETECEATAKSGSESPS